jgi:PAS domain S-box-containing protein
MENLSNESTGQDIRQGITQKHSQIGLTGAVQQQTSSALAGDVAGSLAAPPQDFGFYIPKPSSSEKPFDLSSYDPLQAHALQLAVTAGFPMPSQQEFTAPPSTGATPRDSTTAQASFSLQTQSLPQQYFYMQNPATNALGVIVAAPSSQMQPPHILAGQVPAMSPQTYITTGATHAPKLVPNNYGDPSIFAIANQHAAATTTLQASEPYVAGQAPLFPAPQSNAERVTAGAATALALAARASRHVTPSVVSSSASETTGKGMFSHSQTDSANMSWNRKQPPPAPATSDDGQGPFDAHEEEKRRHERNMREQQRSLKISQQIQQLRDLLTDSGIPFKPNKFSILHSVADYIKQLQARAIMLDAEHRKLAETIRATSEMASSGDAQTCSGNESLEDQKSSSVGNQSELLFVQGLDYRAAFTQCPAALGVAALDGRILACNNEFQTVLGASNDELLQMSLFNLMQNHQDVFRAMGEMLKSTGIQNNIDNGELPQMYWSGKILSQRNQNVSVMG